MTLVVCVLGQRLDGIEHPDYTIAKNNRWRNIEFMDWPIANVAEQHRYEIVFRRVMHELSTEEGRVLIHCKHGQHRSAFAAYALLRLGYEITEDAARAAMLVHRGPRGKARFRIDDVKDTLKDWLEAALRTQQT